MQSRINGLVVDLEMCALQRRVGFDGEAQIIVHFQGKEFPFVLGNQVTGPGYLALHEHMNSIPALAEVLEKRAKE